MSVRHQLEYAGVRAAVACAARLPDRFAEVCGRGVGRLFWQLDRRHRRTAIANVAAAFPNRTAAEHRAIVRGAFEHFGELLFAVLKFSGLTGEEMLARVEFQGDEHVRAAHARNAGVLFVTGHFGFWEIQALVHALRLPPMAVLARTLDNPALNDLLEHIRTRTGNTVIYRQGTLRGVLRALHANHGVGVLVDQHTLSRDAVDVSFFGRPAATTPLVATLALRTGAPVIPLFALPLGGGRYRLVYEPPVPPPVSDDPDAIRDFTQRCSDVLEMYVRRCPERWLWMHRRWR
jgi:KDO2-lipid IV(A) lauroyltransferase